MKYSSVIERGRVSVMFTAKPAEPIRAMLKRNGFRWSPQGGFWWRSRVQGAADFFGALDKALNPGRPDGACWGCKDPAGFFRNCGASAPVYCEKCWRAYCEAREAKLGASLARVDPMGVDTAYEDSCRDQCGL